MTGLTSEDVHKGNMLHSAQKFHPIATYYQYADDTKLYREIKSPDDHQILQNDLSKLCTWSKKWLLKFHPKKCSCLTIGKKLESPSYSYDLSSHM